MGLFSRKRNVTEPTSPDAGLSTESRRFAEVIGRGDLDAASAVVESYLNSGAVDAGEHSLLARASMVQTGLREDRLDEVAAALYSWDDAYSHDLSTLQGRAHVYTLGLGLLWYFNHPRAKQHRAFDGLMDGQLRNLGKETHRVGEPFFGDLFARGCPVHCGTS